MSSYSQPEAAPLTRPSGQIEHLAELYRQMLLIRRIEHPMRVLTG